jgi:Gpi18-like mannosyltransferase
MRAKSGTSALKLVGWIFSFMGSIFCLVAILSILKAPAEVVFIGYIFFAIGGLFLSLGVFFLVLVASKRIRSQKVIDNGHYVWGTIADCVYNYNVCINGRHPYRAIVRYMDPMGITHIFKSIDINRYMDPGIIGKRVKVYVSSDNMNHYYVDISSILTDYIEH